MIDLSAVNDLLDQIEDDDLREHAEKLISDLTRSLKMIVHDQYYEIKTGPEMLKSVLNLHKDCCEDSIITGLQTMLPENMTFLQSTGNRRFHEVTKNAIERKSTVRRVLLVDRDLVSSRRDFASVIRNYYKPQLDAGVSITIHEFGPQVLKEHPGHDFTVFRISQQKTICAEGGPIHKQADEVGYLGRIWKDDEHAGKLIQHYEMLKSLPEIEVPKEFLRPAPRVFIGSSVEGLKIAEYIQQALVHNTQPIVWSQGAFGLSEGTLEALVRMSDQFDYAVLVLTPDDMKISRGQELPAARDNVLFELGLFMGSLGHNRTFIVYCSDEPPSLPSDLAGVTPATYPGNLELQAAVGVAATRIKTAIEKNTPQS